MDNEALIPDRLKRIMVCGDWHGNQGTPRWAEKLVILADRLGIKKIIQCGDFGFWDHREEGVRFLDALNAECRRTGVQVYWLDGNHENFHSLGQYLDRAPRTYLGHVMIRSHIMYCPRGLRWEWGGKYFMTVGGAVSIDRYIRTPGVSWWPEEQLTDELVAKLELVDLPVDYLFTHDCPENAPFRDRLKADIDSQIHRHRMTRVGKITKPQLWFHGHMHERYAYEFPHAKGTSHVFGLECNGMPFNHVVLDTETNTVVWAPRNVKELQSGLKSVDTTVATTLK